MTDSESSKRSTQQTLLVIAAIVTAGLLAAAFLYVAPAPLPSLEQIADMEKRCESFGYRSKREANAFKHVAYVNCVDKEGNLIGAKPDSTVK